LHDDRRYAKADGNRDCDGEQGDPHLTSFLLGETSHRNDLPVRFRHRRFGAVELKLHSSCKQLQNEDELSLERRHLNCPICKNEGRKN
jgi:hypothetical protein